MEGENRLSSLTLVFLIPLIHRSLEFLGIVTEQDFSKSLNNGLFGNSTVIRQFTEKQWLLGWNRIFFKKEDKGENSHPPSKKEEM